MWMTGSTLGLQQKRRLLRRQRHLLKPLYPAFSFTDGVHFKNSFRGKQENILIYFFEVHVGPLVKTYSNMGHLGDSVSGASVFAVWLRS